jgi:hypothetical protein
MTFYQSVLGGELTVSTFGEFHASEDPTEQDKVMHSQLETADGFTLMAADTPNAMEHRPQQGVSVSISGDDEAARLLGRAERGRDRDHAFREGAVGRHVRHVPRPLRHALDGQRGRQPARLSRDYSRLSAKK